MHYVATLVLKRLQTCHLLDVTPYLDNILRGLGGAYNDSQHYGVIVSS